MNKKTCVAVFLCFFGLSIICRAQEKKDKASIIEHLTWATTGSEEAIKPADWDNSRFYGFDTEPFLSFHVIASPKSEALFLEFWGQSHFQWWIHTPQIFICNLKIKLISDVIPENIEVYILHGLTNISGITHYDDNWHYDKRHWKLILRKDSMLRYSDDWWNIKFIGTEEDVPPETAQDIFNSIIENGFNVEMSAFGETEGVQNFFLYAFNIEVTRLSRRPTPF